MATIRRRYILDPAGTGWRERLSEFKAAYTNRNLDEVHQDIENKVYAMALDGADMPTIAGYFGISRKDLTDAYGHAWQAGNAELRAIIAQNTVEYGLESKIPVAKIWLGKAIGGLGEGKSTDVERDTDDSGDVTLKIKVISRDTQAE